LAIGLSPFAACDRRLLTLFVANDRSAAVSGLKFGGVQASGKHWGGGSHGDFAAAAAFSDLVKE
jgi:hypothetical protein